jgi:Domain of Unknown Function (DUF928)
MTMIIGGLLVAAGLVFPAPTHTQQGDRPKKPTSPNLSSKSESANRPSAKRKIPTLKGFDMIKPGKRSANVGATRGPILDPGVEMPPPAALAPERARVYGRHPQFAWEDRAAAASYEFVLSNESSEPVFHSNVKGESYSYPENAPALNEGAIYMWRVAANGPMGEMRESSPVGFKVVSGDERRKIERSLRKISTGDAYQHDLKRARVFRKFRLWYDAIKAYSDLIEHDPNRAELYNERGTIYGQFEVTQKLANQDFARADELKGIVTPEVHHQSGCCFIMSVRRYVPR